MAKGDDAMRRKKKKAISRKLRKKNDSSAVSAKVAAVIAAKKRRKAGKRRMCQGMCFSLPTPDDPFNDQHGKEEFKIKGPKNKTHSLKDETVMVPLNGKNAARRKDELSGIISKESNHLLRKNEFIDMKNKQKRSVTATNNLGKECTNNTERANVVVTEKGDLGGARQGCGNSESPSKFLFWCLNSIENALRHDDAYTDGEGNSLFVNSWGVEFWKCYSTGKDVMETSGNSATTEQIAWMVSGAADTIARKEKQGLSFASPFLLFLVPSQEKAAQVRLVCKPLKSLGIHTVSIHPGASLDHQIQGLKSCEPEYLVSTPERLLELISLKAVDISGVSMLVVDGLNTICSAGYTEMIKSIKKFISGDLRLVVFNDSFSHTSIPMVRYLLTGSICRLSLCDSITSLSSCIIQSVKVCTSEEDKLVTSIQALDQFWSSRTHNLNLLYILREDVKCHKLVAALESKGCSIALGSDSTNFNDSVYSKNKLGPVVSMIDLEDIFTEDLGTYDVVVLPSFVPSMDTYVHVLTRMARQSVNGVLHSFLTKENSELAGPLIEILEQCGQEVPQTLKNLHHTSNMTED